MNIQYFLILFDIKYNAKRNIYFYVRKNETQNSLVTKVNSVVKKCIS